MPESYADPSPRQPLLTAIPCAHRHRPQRVEPRNWLIAQRKRRGRAGPAGRAPGHRASDGSQLRSGPSVHAAHPTPGQARRSQHRFQPRPCSVAVADTTGHAPTEHRRTVNVEHQATVALDTTAALLTRCLADAELGASDLISVPAGIPGPLDTKNGPRPLADDPVRMGRRGSLARDSQHGLPRRPKSGTTRTQEHTESCGAARRFRDFTYVKASHGTGAGLVLDGDTDRGRRQSACNARSVLTLRSNGNPR